MKQGLFAIAICLAFQTLSARAQHADVLTEHNDVARTGANLRETILTPATVRSNFGRLFSLAVDGQIYAQPLVVSDVAIPGKGARDVVYVATMKNNVYAFDAGAAEAGSPLWKTNLGTPVPYQWIPFNFGAVFGMYNIRPFIGITSTPVIDRASGRMWLAAKELEPPTNLAYRLWCLDIKTGAVPGRSAPVEAGAGADRLQAQTALQRPALLFANGMIYAAFGSHQDAGYYHGWLVAFDATTLKPKYTFCTTPGDESGEGGIWQSGNGPAADAGGNIYVITGNGSFKPGRQYGSSFVKLDAQLNVLDWFTPSTYSRLNREDLDLGSTGPVLLPDSDGLIGAGKEGRLYLLRRDNLGGLQPRHSVAPALQVFRVSGPWKFSLAGLFDPALGYHHVHGSPVCWNSSQRGMLVYVWPEGTRLKEYRYDPTNFFEKRPAATGLRAPPGMPGGMLSISANGRTNGVLWAATPLKGDAFITVVQGALRAFDAETLEQLWATDASTPEDIFAFAKFCPPTICNGRVYLATFSDRINVYGLVPPALPLPDWTKSAGFVPKGEKTPTPPRRTKWK